jgi:integrase
MASIDRRNGRYRVRYRTPDGRGRSKSFRKRADADRFAAVIEADKARGVFVDPAFGRMTLGQYVEEHYRPTMHALELTTKARDDSYLRTHVLPAFGGRPLSSIDHASCQQWVNELAGRRSPATVVKAAQIMGKVMKTAVRARRIPYNPMADVVLPSVDDPEDTYLTPAQVATIADAMTEIAPRYRVLVWLGCYGGPRIGELLALRWTDLEERRRTMTIARKVVEVSGAGMVEGPTKTKAGRRTLTLPRAVWAEVEQHRERFGGSSDLVITTGSGQQVRANNLRRREWAAAAVAAGLGRYERRRDGTYHYVGLKFHDMRHTAVSLWVAAGATDLEVAKWAGHRSAAFTKSRYAHLFPEYGEELADRLDEFISSATTTPAARPQP